MAGVRVTREGVTLRFGESDTPAPEGDLSGRTPPNIVVAISPADPNARIGIVLDVAGTPRHFSLVPVRRTPDEVFFEGSFAELRIGEAANYVVSVEVQRPGGPLRFDSAEAAEGRRSIRLVEDVTPRRPTVTTPGTIGGVPVEPIPIPRRPDRDPGPVPSRPVPDDPRVPSPPGNGSEPTINSKVSGRIILENGVPAPEVPLRIYRRVFGGERKVVSDHATDKTGKSGEFSISYATPGTPNIEIYAVTPSGEEVQLSRTKFSAGTDEKMDLIAPVKVRPQASEFARLTEACGKILDSKPEKLADAIERGDRRDISTLATVTRWDARALALASSAFTAAPTTKIPADALYALYRFGFPTNTELLGRVDRASVETALTKAAQVGIIDAAGVEAATKAFDEFAALQRLSYTPPGKLGGIAEFIKTAPIPAPEAAAFTSVMKASNAENIWVRAKAAGVSEAGIAKLKLQGKLAYLTLNNAELTSSVQAKLVAGDALRLIDLNYDKSGTWQRELTELAGGDDRRLGKLIPPAFEGRTNQERLAVYSDELARRVRYMDPNKVTMRQLERGDLDGLDAGARVGVNTFLANAVGKGFRLGQTAFSDFVKDKEDELMPGMTVPQRSVVKENVRKLIRLYSLSPTDEALNLLLKKGFRSAFDIARLSFHDFDRLMGSTIQTRVKKQLYWKAQQASATIVNVFSGAKRLGVEPPLARSHDDHQRVLVDAKEKLSGRYPTLEKLFGGVDYCECDHCHSVLSPAAYLVDVLHFIDPDDQQWPMQKSLWSMAQSDSTTQYPYGRPFEELIARRPDISRIPLTCENTNTALPYIDIVNEVLEHVVAGGTSGIKAFDTGSASSADLIAEPQNITWKAYINEGAPKGLKSRVFPLTLPFDLPLEMVRGFLKGLDLPLWKLREQVGRPDKLFAAAGSADGLTDVWLERLGLGPADISVLVEPTSWYALYGYTAENAALADLVKAKDLSRRLGVSYKELVELLKTSFLNPALDNLVVLRRLEVDPQDLERYLNPGQSPLSNTERSEFDALLAKNGLTAADLGPLWTDAVREQVVLLRSNALGYDFSGTSIVFAKTPPDSQVALAALALVFRKLNAFVRLQRKLGWETRRLDKALRAFVRPSVSGLAAANWEPTMRTALIYLAHLRELAERAGERVTEEELLILWSPIPTSGGPSLYEQLFLNRAVLATDPVFAHKLGRYFENSTEFVSGHLEAIRQALQLTPDEVSQILAHAKIANATLSIANLSVLMRYRVLARILNVTVQELVTLLALSTRKPLQEVGAAPIMLLAQDTPYAETIAFVKEVDLQREAGLTTEAIEGICRHRGPQIDEASYSPVVDRLLLALSGIPRTAPLAAGATDAQKKEFEEARMRERVAGLQAHAAEFGAPEPLVSTLVATVLKDPASGKPLIDEGLDLRTSPLPLKGTAWVRYVWFAAGGNLTLTTKTANPVLKFGARDDAQTLQPSNGTFKLADVKAGERYRLELTLSAESEISFEGNPAVASIAPSDYAKFATAVARLRKALSLLSALDVTAAELDYVRSLAGALTLDALPLAPVADDAIAQATFAKLLPWIELAATRRRYGAGDRVVAVLAAASRRFDIADQEPAFNSAFDGALAGLTGWKLDFIKTVRSALGYTTQPGATAGSYEVAGLKTGADLRSLTDAVAAVIRMGLSATDVAAWSKQHMDSTTATKIRAALKGRYTPSAWRKVAQPVFDVLRKKQRDALVAYLTNPDQPNYPYGQTQEQLFEHLLLDPGTEPPVLASRIQLAISSVQLFIQRCLMNFEARVAPSIIDTRRWPWMSRYRVWEVNRKMFLWPENWLDPEFRDDKSHLFRELEGALLQGDVSDDLARTALFAYLQGLEGIARLDMMTMYFEPGLSPDASIVHVIGRTPNAPYRYFYRKCSHRMWTPWEPLDVEIDGEHLTLTVWRGRMHLFWVTFFEKAAAKAGGTETMEKLGDKTRSELEADKLVQLQLNWVEQVDGKWTTRSSTDGFVDADSFKNLAATEPSDKREFAVHVKIDPRDLDRAGDDVVQIHLSRGDKANYFELFSKLAPPVLKPNGSEPTEAAMADVDAKATKWLGTLPLAINFEHQITQADGGTEMKTKKDYQILGNQEDYRLLFPTNEIRLDPGQTLPRAKGRANGYVFAPQRAQHVVYQGADGNIHDVWSTPNGWYHSVASAGSDDPASGDPRGYPLDEAHMHCIAYVSDRKLIELSWSRLDGLGPIGGDPTAGWVPETLYEAANDAARPEGRPLGGMFAPKRGVVFRTADGLLRAAVDGPGSTWQPRTLSGGAVPAPASEPTGVVLSTTVLGVTTIQSRHIFFATADGRIHELRSDATAAAWAYTDITTATGAPPPAPGSQPAAYAFSAQKSVHVVYRDQNGVVQELSRSTGAWSREAIGAQSATAKGDPSGYATEFDGTRHVVYRAQDDGIRELRWRNAKWSETNLTQSGAAPKPDSDPSGYSFEPYKTQHVVFTAEDGRLRELSSDGAGWSLGVYQLAKPDFEPIGPLIAPFFYEDLEAPHTFFVEPSLAERTVHDWEEYVVTTEERDVYEFTGFIEIIPWFPERVDIKPSDWGVIPKLPPDEILGGDLVLTTDRGVFDSTGGVRRPADVLRAVAVGERVTTPVVRMVDARRGVGTRTRKRTPVGTRGIG